MRSSFRFVINLPLWVAGVLLCTLPVRGQPEEAERLIPRQSLTFFILSSNEDPEQNAAETVFQFEDQQGINGVTAAPGSVAGPFVRNRMPHLDLFRIEEIPAEPGTPPDIPPQVVRHPLRRISLPEEAANVFLLVRTDARTGDILGVQALNQSEEVLPEGHLGLISFIPMELSVRLGDGTGVLPAGGRTLLPVRKGGGLRPNMVLFLAGGPDDEGNMVIKISRRISVNPNFRRLALLFPEAGGTVNLIMLPPASSDPLPLDPENGVE